MLRRVPSIADGKNRLEATRPEGQLGTGASKVLRP
jgi:hypothetical protein